MLFISALHKKSFAPPQAIEFFSANLISFTPGFSQVNCAKLRLETV